MEEMQSSHELAAKQHGQTIQDEIARLQTSFGRERDEFERTISQSRLDLSAVADDSHKVEAELTDLKASLQNLLEAAQVHFTAQFSSITQLADHLRQTASRRPDERATAKV
jgi:methyl-accepting chemotaxis protein